MTDNKTWTIHDPSGMMNKNGILTILVTGKANWDGYDCGFESWYMFPDETGWRPGNCILRQGQRPEWWDYEVTGVEAAWAPGWLSPDKAYYSLTPFLGWLFSVQASQALTVRG